jgi:hypothetical protein
MQRIPRASSPATRLLEQTALHPPSSFTFGASFGHLCFVVIFVPPGNLTFASLYPFAHLSLSFLSFSRTRPVTLPPASCNLQPALSFLPLRLAAFLTVPGWRPSPTRSSLFPFSLSCSALPSLVLGLHASLAKASQAARPPHTSAACHDECFFPLKPLPYCIHSRSIALVCYRLAGSPPSHEVRP